MPKKGAAVRRGIWTPCWERSFPQVPPLPFSYFSSSDLTSADQIWPLEEVRRVIRGSTGRNERRGEEKKLETGCEDWDGHGRLKREKSTYVSTVPSTFSLFFFFYLLRWNFWVVAQNLNQYLQRYICWLIYKDLCTINKSKKLYIIYLLYII